MLTKNQIAQLALFDIAMIAALGDVVNAVDDLSLAGNVNLGTYLTRLTVNGTMALTLPNGTVEGQRKKVACEAGSNTPAATLTITTPDTTTGYACPSTVFFDTPGQAIEFLWTGAAWRCTKVWRAGQKTLVVGTTVTTGLALYALYALAVTGTEESSGTKGLPNGNCVGDQCSIGCNLAASTPVGSIDAVANLASGVAGTGGSGGTIGKIGAFSATTSNCRLEWIGTAWQIVSAIGGVVVS